MPYEYNVYETDNNIDYMTENPETFHRAFKDLSNKQSVSTDDTYGKVLFTYSHQGGTIAKDKDGYLATGRKETPLPAEMDISQYNKVYTHLPFQHPAVQQVDNKLRLFQLYKDDRLASKVFPKSYSSYVDALLDTKSTETENSIFYIKDAGAARGEDIYIKTWDELAADYQELKEEGEYDVDEGEGDVIIQRAVKDLWTLDGDGPISGRRFDIRFFVLVTKGSVYLHSFQLLRWAFGGQTKYDPNDTNEENQILNIAAFAGGDIARLFFSDKPTGDWTGGKKRWEAGSANNGRFDPHGWRDAVADALDDASGVFDNLKELTKDDPTKYVLAGGDAIIKEDGTAVLIEFNVWPDVNMVRQSDANV